ncbi:MAG: hypothetical protein ACREPB_16625 [Arenimonas sp.]
MKPLIAFALILSASTAQATIKGQCVYEGKTLHFIDAHAAMGQDPFEEKLKVPMLWFTTKPLDHAALLQAKSDEIDDAVTDQVFEKEGAKLELRLDAEGKLVEGLQLYVPPGNNRSVSSNEVGELKLNAPMATRANGRFILSDDSQLKCDLQFDVAIAGKGPPPPAPKPWGVALPAGGGEPGKVYMAMHRATLAGDIDTMLKLATKERADKMREARKDPEFPKMMQMIKAFEPAQVRILSGRADATRAELQIDGKESDGAVMTGVVKLVMEAGSWRIENVSTKSKM